MVGRPEQGDLARYAQNVALFALSRLYYKFEVNAADSIWHDADNVFLSFRCSSAQPQDLQPSIWLGVLDIHAEKSIDH